MGRINLVKMILLPKLLYLFWHTPFYIPPFKSMEAILNTFVWGSSRHKLSWQVLKCPVHLGGTAFPDLVTYNIASQLSHYYYYIQIDKDRYSVLVCSPALAQLPIHSRSSYVAPMGPRTSETICCPIIVKSSSMP